MKKIVLTIFLLAGTYIAAQETRPPMKIEVEAGPTFAVVGAVTWIDGGSLRFTLDDRTASYSSEVAVHTFTGLSPGRNYRATITEDDGTSKTVRFVTVRPQDYLRTMHGDSYLYATPERRAQMRLDLAAEMRNRYSLIEAAMERELKLEQLKCGVRLRHARQMLTILEKQ